MNFKGHVEGGVVVVDEPTAELPDGTEVEIRVITPANRCSTVPSPLLKYLGAADDLPPDASQTIDHAIVDDNHQPLTPNEPESELEIFVRSTPKNVRLVKVQILSRTRGVPNPILPDLGE